MFNPLTPSDMMLAVGRVLKETAGAGGPADEWRRGQLLSAYSVSRHLAAEVDAANELRSWFRASAAEIIRDGGLDGSLAGAVEAEGTRIAASDSNSEIGESMCAVMRELREAGTPEAEAVAGNLRGLMREMCDREVLALAETGS